MDNQENYLKQELYKLIKDDDTIFDFLQNGSLDGIWYWDIENPESEWMSPEFWSLFGYDYKTKKSLASEWQDMIFPEDLAVALNNFKLHCEDPKHPYDQIVRYKHKDGSTVWVRCRGIAIRDDNGKPIRMLGAHTDLTKLKETEINLRKKQSLLEEMSSMASIGGWEINLKIDELSWTEEVYRIHEVSPDFIPQVQSAIDFYHPDFRPIISEAVDELIKNSTPFDLELKIITEKGNEKWVESIGHTMIEDGKVIGISGTIQDISERKKNEEENIRLQEQINHKSKMDALGQIAGGVAHDFNNLLSAIMNSAQLLGIKELNLSNEGREYLELIRKSSENGAALTQQLLHFARNEEGVKSTVNLQGFMDNTLGILEKSLDKIYPISLTNSDRDLKISCIKSSLQNVIINICINSSHAMPEGGEIRISTNKVFLDRDYCQNSFFEIEPGDYLNLTISDTGIGIPSENLDKIFDPFFTTKGLGEGTGLGLATVFGIIKKHNGEGKVKSKVGEGTTFNILLPLSEEDTTSHEEVISITKGVGTILFVDDEDFNRVLGREVLESIGYHVLVAENGQHAIDIFNKKHSQIDLVIMDMIMPKMGGKEAFLKMKEIDNSVKVVIATGYSNENLDSLKAIGLSGSISKPYGIEDISNLVSKVLQ